jgi:hypothetical protein
MLLLGRRDSQVFVRFWQLSRRYSGVNVPGSANATPTIRRACALWVAILLIKVNFPRKRLE